MSVDSVSSPVPIQPMGVLIVDDDPAFRVGLRIWLERFLDLQVIADVSDGAAALEAIAQATAEPVVVPLRVVVINAALAQAYPAQIQGLTLCQSIKERYPDLAVLMLGTAREPVVWAAAQQVGASGYCLRSLPPEDLVGVIRRVGAGQSLWGQVERNGESEGLASRPDAALDSSLTDLPPDLTPRTQAEARSRLGRMLQRWRFGMRVSGVQQIDAAIATLLPQLQDPDLSLLERAIASGQYRELRAARWMVNHLLATPELPTEPPAKTSPQPPIPGSPVAIRRSKPPGSAPTPPSPQVTESPEVIPTTPATDASTQAIVRLQSIVFDGVLVKLNGPLQNMTSTPLEIDILREERKRELFYLILRQIERLLDELRYSQVTAVQMGPKRSQLLTDLWAAVTTDFFGKYYTVAVQEQPIEVVDVLLGDRDQVQENILNKIPFTLDLITHFLFQTPLVIDGMDYAAGNPAAVERAQLILENWVIQVANAVMQPLLNTFAHVESIKQNLYDRRLMSSRDIERFRNDLSWRYRLMTYFVEPQAIFESRYLMFTFRGRGIRQLSIYAPRTAELETLDGIPFVVTLALEARDALAPRVRSVIGFLGSSVVYVLTEVIGRGIGLIGRGVLKGVGSSWQDSRFSQKNSPRDPFSPD
jgi:DNA-binding NarL/FixJ family response regulator